MAFRQSATARRSNHRRVSIISALVIVGISGGASAAAAMPQSSPEALAVSMNANRTEEQALASANLHDDVYIYVDRSKVRRVDFYLDTKKSGIPTATETAAPFDLGGTNTDGSARPLDTHHLVNGQHKLVAVITGDGGRTQTATATFRVNNNAVTQPTPTPTPTTDASTLLAPPVAR